jgi:hypothetical protein
VNKSKVLQKSVHFIRPLLFHGIHDRCFGWRIRRQRRDCRPRGRFYQKISSWMHFDRRGITFSTGSTSGSGSTRVLIACESCMGTYSLPTFSSNSWSLGTFSQDFHDRYGCKRDSLQLPAPHPHEPRTLWWAYAAARMPPLAFSGQLWRPACARKATTCSTPSCSRSLNKTKQAAATVSSRSY